MAHEAEIARVRGAVEQMLRYVPPAPVISPVGNEKWQRDMMIWKSAIVDSLVVQVETLGVVFLSLYAGVEAFWL